MKKNLLLGGLSKWNRLRLERRRKAKLDASIKKFRNSELVILTPRHCLTLAQDLKRYLADVGRKALIVTDEKYARGKLAIVICPQIFKKLPKHFIAIQMEQSVSSRWFTDEYFNVLKSALAVIDYSKTNISFLLKKSIPFANLFYMPILPDVAHQSEDVKRSIDVLFYGDVNNERRSRMLGELSKQFSIKVVNNTFGEELIQDLRSAKVVLNIHYYEGALLESVRLSEALRHGAIVVSERAADGSDYQMLSDVVDFVDIGDVAAMSSRIAHWLDDEGRRQERVQSNNLSISRTPTETKFHFLRVLLALDFIEFDDFYTATREYFDVHGGAVCLGLPESIDRRLAFEAENVHGFRVFPGLRHPIGWVGCGMSYKYLMLLASESQLNAVTICEDDVGFSPSHLVTMDVVHRYLKGHEWDLFSGFMADVCESTEFSGVQDVEGVRFLHLNKLVSTVFNIYNRSFFGQLESWDPRDRNPVSNTIDRFIQAQPGLKVVTTMPFLVEHKEDLDSTIWGFNNAKYKDMVEKSMERLRAISPH